MTDLHTPLEIVFYAAALVVIPVVIGRLLTRGAAPLRHPFVMALDPPWPRGVQEEEPVRYLVERLRPRGRWRDPRRSTCAGTAIPATGLNSAPGSPASG